MFNNLLPTLQILLKFDMKTHRLVPEIVRHNFECLVIRFKDSKQPQIIKFKRIVNRDV